MRFSITKLILAVLVVNIVICLTFAAPYQIGIPILTFVSLFVIPPVLLVGAINTRGAQQAFFLGCMVSGIAHFIISVYMAGFIAIGNLSDFGSEEFLKYIHLVGYVLGLIGGCSGAGAYVCVAHEDKKKKSPSVVEKPVDPFADDLDDSFDPQASVEGDSSEATEKSLASTRPR